MPQLCRHAFEFDTAFDEDAPQDQVYKICCPSFVEDALAGINSCVLLSTVSLTARRTAAASAKQPKQRNSPHSTCASADL